MSHAVRIERSDEALEIVTAADLRVQRPVIDDVVAVRAAWARAQVGRAIHVTHAERSEVRDQRGCVGECESAIHLHAVSRAWYVQRTRARRGCRSPTAGALAAARPLFP